MYQYSPLRENSTMRVISTIVIHHSASERATVEQIDEWHRQRGFRRRASARAQNRPHLTSIGYHRVIDVSGEVYAGRDLDEMGAHARGSNKDSVGVCLVGNGKFTHRQWASLFLQLKSIVREVGHDLVIVGHKEVTEGTECPGFDVPAWLASGGLTPAEHVR